jgi:putative hydrolase of the HAD superfamily
MSPPRALLFDLGGTVLHQEVFRPDAWAGALRDLAPALTAPPDAVEAQARDLVRDFRHEGRLGLAEVRIGSCLRHLHERLGLALPLAGPELELAFWRATSRMTPAPGITLLLRHPRLRGLPLGIVSNSSFGEEVLRWELARHGLAEAFALVLSSADYGLRKPHPSLFLTAAARLALPPHEVCFVGDNFTNDVVGARAAGMVPVWYNPRGRPAPAGAEAPPELRHWDELSPLLVQSS